MELCNTGVISVNQREIWEQIAPEWQKYRKKPREEITDFLKKQRGRILDLGCGSGRNFRKGPTTVGLDFSKRMLTFAGRNAKKAKIKFLPVRGDIVDLPFRDNSFDSVLFAFSLHCVKKNNHRKVLQEVKRISKNRAYVFIGVWNKNQPRFQNTRRETTVPWETKSGKYDRYCYLYTKDELKSLVKRAGFTNIRVFGSSDKAFFKFPKNLVAICRVKK